MATVDTLFQGFPGRSPTYGSLGWCSLSLVREGDINILFDTGGMGMLKMLIQRLEARELSPSDIDVLVLSHAHWDHAVGFPLFSHAEIVIGQRELDWALNLRLEDNLSVPPFLVQHLAEYPRLRTIGDGEELLSGVTMIDTPGHTPGHMSMVVVTDEGKVVLAEDAIKNRAEFLTRTADNSMDEAASSASIDKIASIADIVVPGHDRAFRIENGRAAYLGRLTVEIIAKTSMTLDEETAFAITLR